MSWAQQREAIRIAAEAGVRARTSAAGSETLPLRHHHLRYAMLSRPNGELTRAGQYYYQLIGRPPPSRQYDRNQPLIREGPNDYRAPGGRQKAAPQPTAQRELPLDQAREELLQGQVGGLGGARARQHPRHPAKRPEPRHALRAHEAPARHGPQRHTAPAERGALGCPSGPEPQGVRARAAREPRAERHHPGAVRRNLLPGRDEGVDLQPAGHAGRGRPGGGGHRPGSAPGGSAGRLLPAVLRRRNPRVRLRTTAGQALRPSAARGADAAAAAGGAFGLRRNLHQKNVAGAGHHPPRDPGILPLAPSPDVLRGLPGPPAGQVRAFGQGAAGRGLHELERPRLLLQIRPHRREVRADRGAGQVSPAAISSRRTWSRSGGSSWPRGTARRWSCEA